MWTLVSLAALHAMECGRRSLWQALHHDPLCSDPSTAVPGPVVCRLANMAAAHFWNNLEDVVSANPKVLDAALPFNHPFVCSRAGALAVNILASNRLL